MTKKDYDLIADAIAQAVAHNDDMYSYAYRGAEGNRENEQLAATKSVERDLATRAIVSMLSSAFKQRNERFDADKFEDTIYNRAKIYRNTL